jgi:hypothetical protein
VVDARARPKLADPVDTAREEIVDRVLVDVRESATRRLVGVRRRGRRRSNQAIERRQKPGLRIRGSERTAAIPTPMLFDRMQHAAEVTVCGAI